MPRQVYNKLIRDNIPEIIKADRNCEPEVSVLDEKKLFLKYVDEPEES